MAAGGYGHEVAQRLAVAGAAVIGANGGVVAQCDRATPRTSPPLPCLSLVAGVLVSGGKGTG